VTVIKGIIASIFFLLELSMLASFVYWGFHIGKGLFLKILIGIGTPILVAFIWGTFIAPKATFPVTVPITIILQSILFGLAAAALFFSGKGSLALIFAIVVIIEMVLMYVLEI
jgi:hypothetical protein